MKLTMGENKFDVPQGTYQAKFLGCQTREPLQGTDYGPGLEWRFEIVSGPSAGKLCSRTTGQEPSAKNACGRMLVGITGGTVVKGQEVDISTYIGRLYLVTLAPNQAGTGVRVETAAAMEGYAPPAQAARPVSTVGGPPPRRNQAVAPTPPSVPGEKRFWVVTGGADAAPEELGWTELERWVQEKQIDPADVEVCEVGSQEWKKAADFGVQSAIPF